MTIMPTIQRRKLGRTDMQVTQLALGGAWLGYNHETNHRDEDIGAATVLHALELGIRVIDTSGGYGPSETIIGNALTEWFRRGGKRDDIVISSKTGSRPRPRNYSSASTWDSVEQSLKSLKVGSIDVMHVHDPDHLEPVFASDGALGALKDMKSQGIIGAIGLGVRRHEFHKQTITHGDFDVSLTYGDFNLLNQSAHGLIDLAGQHNVGVFNAMVVEYGLLSGTDPDQIAARWKGHEDKVKVNRARELWSWSQSRKINLLAVAIQYSTRDPRIASTLVGAATPAEIEVDVNAFLEQLPDDTWVDLHERFGI